MRGCLRRNFGAGIRPHLHPVACGSADTEPLCSFRWTILLQIFVGLFQNHRVSRTASTVEQPVPDLDSLVYLIGTGLVVYLPQPEAHLGHLVAIVELDTRNRHCEDVQQSANKGWVKMTTRSLKLYGALKAAAAQSYIRPPLWTWGLDSRSFLYPRLRVTRESHEIDDPASAPVLPLTLIHA